MAEAKTFACPFCELECSSGPSIDAAFAHLSGAGVGAPAVIHIEPVCDGFASLDTPDFLRAAGRLSTAQEG